MVKRKICGSKKIPSHGSPFVITNFDLQDKQEQEEDEDSDPESSSPFKLSKWEIMDKEEKMGKFFFTP